MDETLTPRQLRRGGLLAALAAPVLTAAGVASAMFALTCDRTAQDGTISAVVAAILACALLRLAFASARAARDLRREASTATLERAHDDAPRDAAPCVRTPRPASARTRTAGLFLALAAFTTIGAQAASADDAAPRPSFTISAASEPGVPTTDVVRAPLLDAPHPTFTGATPGKIVDLTVVTAPAATDEPAGWAAPLPRWTPDPRNTTTSLSPLVLGASSSSGSNGTRAALHVVIQGDTLWSIAASHLPPHAPAEQVAAALPGWIAANPLLRLDPDLLEVGQELTVPSPASATGAQR